MRSRKAFLNILFSIIYQVASLICGLITPRLILSAFGSTYNGVISSASQFLSMITILTMGISGATRVALYPTLAKGDVLGTSRIMKATKRYMRKVAYCIIVYVVLLCIIYPRISHNDLSHSECTLLIVIVSLGTFAQYFFGASNSMLLLADQASYIEAIINTIKTLLNTAVVVLLVYLKYSIFVVKLGSSIVFFISPFILNMVVKKKYQLIDKCEPDDSGILHRKAAAFHSIANIIHSNTDLVVLTLFMDAKYISVYTVYYIIMNSIRRLMEVFTNGLEGAFGNMWAKNEKEIFSRNFCLLEFVLYSFTAIVFTCTGVLLLPFVAEYTKGVTDINYLLPEFAILVTITEAVYVIRHPYLIIVQATGNYEATKKIALMEAIINVILSITLVFFMGLNGVIIATLVANVFKSLQYARFISKNIVKGSIKQSIRFIIWLVCTTFIILMISGFVTSMIHYSDGWMGWLAKAIITFILATTVTVLSAYCFCRNELLSVLNIVGKMLKCRL